MVTSSFDLSAYGLSTDVKAFESKACTACGQFSLSSFFTLDSAPVHQNLLYASLSEATNCKRGNLNLAFCRACGFIANISFDSSLLSYSQDYENTQTQSQVFQQYLQSIATHLITTHGIKNKTVLEIGCGKGDFLTTICMLGNNKGFGFDPSYLERDDHSVGQIEFVRDFYSPTYSHYHGDLVCCRHVLEHIDNPLSFLRMVRRSIGGRLDTVIFFEVPCARWIMRHLVFWDLFYEHCNYFTDLSLTNIFRLAGFHVTSILPAFQNQYLWLEAIPADNNTYEVKQDPAQLEQLAYELETFRTRLLENIFSVSQKLQALKGDNNRAVLWGAGAKGVTLLNTLRISTAQIPFVVDINPRKHDMFIPGTGQQVVAPEKLLDFRPDCIFVMNPIYEHEIRTQVASLGLSPEVAVL